MKQQSNKWIYHLSFIIVILTVYCGCKKNEGNDLEMGTVTDIEGNVYQMVKIGNQ